MTTKQHGDTAKSIMTAAKTALLDVGYANLSTRSIAEQAGVPLSQIHYHFGSKQALLLAVLDRENQRLVVRQERMFGEDLPLWKQWLQACDFLEDDLASGYVRVLMEMVAAGWADSEIAHVVSSQLKAWFDVLRTVAEEAAERFGGLGTFSASEVAALAGLPFVGAEAMILLGVDESLLPMRSALRKVGALIQTMEEQVPRQ
jgi:AcrR family transcriptional regulator